MEIQTEPKLGLEDPSEEHQEDTACWPGATNAQASPRPGRLKRVPTSSPVARDRRLLVASPGKVEQEARRGQGGGPESGSWAAGSGQSDGEASGGSGQSDGETAAAPSRMKKRLAANASRRGGAGMSVHTSDSDSDAGSPSNA